MDKSKAALGAGVEIGATCTAVNMKNMTERQQIELLQQQVAQMHRVILQLKKSAGTPAVSMLDDSLNKDGIPVGTVCFGATEKSPFLIYLTVEAEDYTVGGKTYPSLSAAAEDVSQVRRSGWTFWRLLDGRTLKEAYKG
jgi:hypothetical protein